MRWLIARRWMVVVGLMGALGDLITVGGGSAAAQTKQTTTHFLRSGLVQGRVALLPQFPISQPGRLFVVLHVVNGGEQRATFKLVILSDDGTTIAAKTAEIEPGASDHVDKEFRGSVRGEVGQTTDAGFLCDGIPSLSIVNLDTGAETQLYVGEFWHRDVAMP